jgi:hypothetical protein
MSVFWSKECTCLNPVPELTDVSLAIGSESS